MEQKVIFLDIDGTLYNDTKQIPASAKEAIGHLQQKGHTVAFATGRAPFSFKSLQDELNIHTFVGLNGQYVAHHGDVIFKKPLETDVIEALERRAEARNHPVIYLGNENWYSNTNEHPYIQKAIASLKIDREVMYDPAYYRSGEVYQVLLFCPGGEEATYEQAFNHLQFMRWHDYSVDVIPADGSKAAGIDYLLKHLQVAPEDVYAFGDGLNDIAMLQSVKNSVAMGNAPDAVKQVAGTVTGHVNEDGLFHGMRKLGLLD